MKLKLNPTKPRNPYVVAALQRAAGSHRSGNAALRQQSARELRRELDRMPSGPTERLRHSP
jgi:hypothetical protein